MTKVVKCKANYQLWVEMFSKISLNAGVGDELIAEEQ